MKGELARVLTDAATEAVRPLQRADAIRPTTGGPAGNARLTAWVGTALLVVFLLEGVTLLSLHNMLTLHIVVGTALVPLVFLKTLTTGWRIVRYYGGDPDYRHAGPPSLAFRVLGPVVVLAGFAVLGTGLALIPLGASSFRSIVTIHGARVSPLTLHKAAFIGWFAITALHVIGRLVRAGQLMGIGERSHRVVPGTWARAVVVIVALAGGLVAGVAVNSASHTWTNGSLTTENGNT
ncbi:MAG: hypothetical protein ACJ735_12375 [Actinomycetes bacterium]